MRPDWNDYFLDVADTISTRGDCTRAQHGAVIVKDNRIVATGYNGSPPGKPGCLTDGACIRGRLTYKQRPSLVGDYSDCIAIHAEANALLYADRDKCEGGTLYVTGEPCLGCWKLIAGSGLKDVVYRYAGKLRRESIVWGDTVLNRMLDGE